MTIESMYPKRDFFTNLNHILDFQINDLKRCVQLANFLVAVGCMNTIEFLGGIRNGELGMLGKVESRFKEGVRLLSPDNGVRRLDRLTQPVDEETMWQLRNGLTHQYLPKVNAVASIFIGAGETSTPYNAIGEIERANGSVGVKSPILLVDVVSLVRAIEQGRGKLLKELRADNAKKSRADEALSRLPELL